MSAATLNKDKPLDRQAADKGQNSDPKKKPSKGPLKLFDYVVVVSLFDTCFQNPPTSKGPPTLTPKDIHVPYRFPAPTGSDPFINSITQFCFPDVDSIKPVTSFEGEKFSFVLTESDGGKRFGYVQRYLQPPTNMANPEPRLPQCLCIVSFFPCFEMFDQILKLVAAKYNMSSAALNAFLSAIQQAELPSPGQSFQVRVPVPGAPPAVKGAPPPVEHYRFTRPAEGDYLLQHINFAPMLQTLQTASMLSLFSSMLLERRVVFVSARLSSLSQYVQAFVALLYPFSWQYIFIPVLPKSLMSFVCAPMPFVVGILSIHLPELRKLAGAMEEVLLFDLDNDKFLLRPFDDRKALPPLYADRLQSEVEFITKHFRKAQKKGQPAQLSYKDLGDVFATFFVDLLAGYRAFLTGAQFDREGFLQKQDDEHTREFLRQFMGMQMFDCFIREREENKDKYTGPFEQRVFMLERLEKSLAMCNNPTEAESLRKAISELKHRGLTKDKLKERAKANAKKKRPEAADPPLPSAAAASPLISPPLPLAFPPSTLVRPQPATAVPSHVTATGRRNSAASDFDVIRFVLNGVPLPEKRRPEPALPSASFIGKRRAPRPKSIQLSSDSATLKELQQKIEQEAPPEPSSEEASAVSSVRRSGSAIESRNPRRHGRIVALRASQGGGLSDDRSSSGSEKADTPEYVPQRPFLGGQRTSQQGSALMPPVELSAPTTASEHTETVSSHANHASLAVSRGEVETWSLADVLQWLNDMGMGTHADTFRQHVVDGNALVELEQEDLQDEMGLDEAQSTALVRLVAGWNAK